MENFTFFWRSKSPFSQWHASVFTVDDIRYTCVEQWMMAEKARLFRDEATLSKILAATEPRVHKALGRAVAGYVDEEWKAVSRNRVYVGNYHKFSQNPDLLKNLMATQGTTLVEASPSDTLWGIGLPEEDPRASNRETWKGLNWLGQVLSALRDDIASKSVNLERTQFD